MSIHNVKNSYVPVAPELHQSFFEPESKPTPDPEKSAKGNSKELLEKVIDQTQKPTELASISTSKSLLDSLGVISHLVNYDYQDTIYGLICPNHPEAKHPHPGPKPKNPNENKHVLSQFVQRGISKKFRENERNYKDAVRHWEAQLKDHLLEVPYLQAKDSLIHGYLELLQNNPLQTLNKIEKAKGHFDLNQDRLGLELIANYYANQDAKCLEIEKALEAHLSTTTLSEFGRNLLTPLAQDKLYQAYQEALSGASKDLTDNKGNLPIERFFPQNLFQAHLEQTCVKLFNAHQGDFLSLIALYLVEETILQPATTPDFITDQMEQNFPHVVRMFDMLEENFNLIEAHALWDHFPLARQLKEEGSVVISQEFFVQLLEELSNPVGFGNINVEREFLMNAIRIQIERNLFEILPYLHQT